MKKIVLLLLLFTGFVKAQIVNIPDVNFKAKLILYGIDNNGDGDIQISEAQNVSYIDVSESNISDLTGIEEFVNVTHLYCFQNQITSLDVSNLTNLQFLFCNSNQITSLNVGGLANLEILYCQSNQLTALDVSNCTNLTELNCSANQITSLNVTGATSIVKLICVGNQISSINLSNLANLTHLDCSLNQLNSLDLSTNSNLLELNCSLNQLSTLNVSNLVAIKKLYCDSNQLNTLNVSGLNTLEELKFSYNYLTSINVTDLINLKVLELSNNQITSINLSTLPLIEKLNTSYNPLTSLNISNLIALKELYCDANQLSNLTLNGLTNLENLSCNGNLLTSLNINFLTNLKFLSCAFNQLNSLDVSSFPNLENLNCYSNTITSLNLSNNNNLQFLNCSINQLTSLDVTNLTQLRSLICGNNAIPNVNFSGLTQLYELYVDSTGRTSLDVSNQPLLRTLYCNSNPIPVVDVSNSLQLYELVCGGPNLTQVFMKNGALENYFGMTLSPNLQFVCGDEGQLAQIQTGIAASGSPAVATSYCSFVPGGNYNTITGNSRFDITNNGCDTNDASTTALKININDGATNEASLVNLGGNYVFYTGAGNFTITPQLENPNYFTVSPNSTVINFPTNSNLTQLQDFCLTANGNHPDVEIVIAPDGVARPGFDSKYKLVYKNKGNQTLSGTINLNFNDSLTDFVSALPVVETIATNSLTWNYDNLQPFESRIIDFVINVNTPTETPPVNSGDVLSFSATISSTPVDELPQDNTFIYNQNVVNSFDPNDITCLQGDSIPQSEIGNYLHYLVRFENTGTFYAENVVTKIEIDESKYDIQTLQVLHTSHSSYTKIIGNKVEFIFEGINLEAAAGNPPVGGHGNVLFKIKSKENLINGDSVSKRANIYFDYNFPIETNLAVTTFQTLNNSIFEFDDTITVYPNPTNGNVNINSKFNIKIIELYDVQGRILETSIENSNESTLDLSKRDTGIYFLKITTDEGSKVEKIVKE